MKLSPLRRTDLLLAQHGYQQHCVTVDEPLTRAELVEPKFWANVASKVRMLDEIRVSDSSGSFYARLFVTYAQGHDIRLKVIEHHVFEVEDAPDYEEEYFLKQRGTHKWCLMKRGNPDPIFQGIATKHEAEKQKAEYLAALAR